ncbi:MAG: initiation factor 2B [Desulfuromonas sp.]|uniref:translation initiation factor eIF-2B n=1 Tax=Desulfuromonas sp. TaxID=892 RepID=UPI000CB79F4C|nr:translation initiation factor eIF-2B [Desulfuromonas sp.]PLX83483.1 MAG: initiation factor 2B [Desulfuromonas sp.]
MAKSEFERRCVELAVDRTRGASELARFCLKALCDSALQNPAGAPPDLRRLLREQAAALAAARPSMAPIDNLLSRWLRDLDALPEEDLAALRQGASEAANRLCRISRVAVERAAAHAARLIGAGKTVLSHSLSSTVLTVFARLGEEGVTAVISESRPLCEGHKLAESLCGWGIPVTLVTDAQLGLFAGQADLALVGADSLLADGSVVNKAGTYPLALAARDQGIPFYVCCESFKRHESTTDPPPLEEMDPAELDAPERPGLTVRNIYFDITPARLVSAWIDENGVRRGE